MKGFVESIFEKGNIKFKLMTINEIFIKGEISVRAFNTCKDNQIETITELKEYFNTYGSFKNFRNCGRKTDSELVAVCLQYFDLESQQINTIDIYSNQNISNLLSDFDEKKLIIIDNFIKVKFIDLSVRSSNALNKFLSGDVSIKNIERTIFRDNYFNLNRINDVGQKSIPELGFFLKEIKTFILELSNDNNSIILENIFEEESKNNILYIIEKLNRTQRQIINNYINISTKKLSNRNKNAISSFLKNEPNLVLLSNNIFSNSMFNISSIKNIGESSVQELSMYINEIKKFIIEIKDKKDDTELNYLELKFLLKDQFDNLSILDQIITIDSIFAIINILIDENYFFKESETFILKKTYRLFENSVYQNLDEIADELKISKARAGQIRKLSLQKLILNLDFLKIFNKNLLEKYKIDLNNPLICLNDIEQNYINIIDNTNFSKQFITLIFSVFLKDEFVIIGNIEDVLILKETAARFRHNWKNIYLLKKELDDYFDVNNLIEDIEVRLNEKINETYKFNFKSYLSRFLKGNNFIIIDEIFLTCEKIIFEEFNIFLSINDEIEFKRNTFKTLPEFAFEALEILGKPSHISEINEQIKILNPDYENEIKNSTLNRKSGFISFSRTSTFGLKKWENENVNIRGGTIRDIVEEYLFDFSEPKSINEITIHVLKFRTDTSTKSIYYNLKMEENNRFVFYKNSLIGLKSKKYDDSELELLDEVDKIEKKSWDENYQDLMSFIKKNNRLPSSMSCPLDEIKINRWLNVQRSKKNRGILEEDKIDKINQVITNYNIRVNKTKLFRIEGYEKLAQFIIKEKRLPSANKKDESPLYAFFYKQRKLFEDGSLEPQEKTKFIEIAKLIQNK